MVSSLYIGGIEKAMTDGIIDKVFEPHEKDYRLTMYGTRVLLKIKQELKSEIENYHFDDDLYFDDLIKSILLGEQD
jgi:hypothetical protein